MPSQSRVGLPKRPRSLLSLGLPPSDGGLRAVVWGHLLLVSSGVHRTWHDEVCQGAGATPWGKCSPANSPPAPKGKGFPVLTASIRGAQALASCIGNLAFGTLLLVLQRRARATWSSPCLLKIAKHFHQAVWLLPRKMEHPEIPVGKYITVIESRSLLLGTSVWPARGSGLSFSPWWP